MITLAIFMFLAAGLFKAVSDVLADKFSSSVFRNRNPFFWDKKQSWQNKYKNRDKDQGPRFPGSTTIFVFLTDAWHLSNFFQYTLITVGVGFALSSEVTNSTWLNILIAFLIYKLPFTGCFELFYRLMTYRKPLLRSTGQKSFFQWLKSYGKQYLIWVTMAIIMIVSTVIYGIIEGTEWLWPVVISSAIFLAGFAFIIRGYVDYTKGIVR